MTTPSEEEARALIEEADAAQREGWYNTLDLVQRLSVALASRASERDEYLKRLEDEERAHGHTIDQRDYIHEIADQLASALAGGEWIGEHSSGNNPWMNALDIAASRVSTPPVAEPKETPDDSEINEAIKNADDWYDALWEIATKYDVPVTNNSPRWQDGRFLRPIAEFIADIDDAAKKWQAVSKSPRRVRHRHLGARTEPYEVFEFPKVTRAVVVGKKFVLFDQRDVYDGGVDVVLQDEGRTLKILPSPPVPAVPVLPTEPECWCSDIAQSYGLTDPGCPRHDPAPTEPEEKR